MRNSKITVYGDLEELSRAAAARFVKIARAKEKSGYTFSVALSGGTTPQRLFELLADENEPYRSSVDWQNVTFFWSDERCTTPESDESNFRMGCDFLLKPLGIPFTNVHRLKGELDPKTAAADYERLLRLIFNVESQIPKFDLILLGMGSDGHTASIFPQSDVLLDNGKLVASPFIEKLGKFRLTLTPAVINLAKNIIILVAGKDKSSALQEVLEGKNEPDAFPAKMVNPSAGKLFWFLDEAAAQSLTLNRTYENFTGHFRR